MVALLPAFATLAIFCSTAFAAPWPSTTQQHTHRIRSFPGLTVRTFHPEHTSKTFGAGIDPPITASSSATSLKDSALAYLHQQLGDAEIEFASGYSAETGYHAYVYQTINGVRVSNVMAQATLNNDGKVVAFSSSFVPPQSMPEPNPTLSEEDARAVVKSKLAATSTDKKATLEYWAKQDGSLALSYVIRANVDGNGHHVETYIDAATGGVTGLIDYTHDFTYEALPVSKQSPDQGIEKIVDPEDLTSSPEGWAVVNGIDTKATSGNNVIVFKGDISNTTAQTSTEGFLATWSASDEPTTASNIDAARINAFYVVNTVHDITYRYGFTEAAFNFQQSNGEKGGAGGDPVRISVQDTAGMNNANMMTPPDGEPGQMRVYLYNHTEPLHDGALQNDVLIHEATHGVTNRLVGGGTAHCLQTEEAGGMGEGWSDALAFWMAQSSGEVNDYTRASFVTNRTGGLRSHPYSTDKKTNPLTYGSLAKLDEVHDIGEVWANMLVNVYAALVKQSGFDITAPTNPDSTAGNAIWLHLFIDSLSLAPCNPTFTDIRDAWIQADKNRYNGVNTCTLWGAFASRGLGVGATLERKDDNNVPTECSSPPAQGEPNISECPQWWPAFFLTEWCLHFNRQD